MKYSNQKREKNPPTINDSFASESNVLQKSLENDNITVLHPTRGKSRPELCPAFGRCPLIYFVFKNLFYQKQCKYAMNIRLTQIRGTFYSFFREKVPFYITAGHCLQFLK